MSDDIFKKLSSLPVDFGLSPGDLLECTTLHPVIRDFEMGKNRSCGLVPGEQCIFLGAVAIDRDLDEVVFIHVACRLGPVWICLDAFDDDPENPRANEPRKTSRGKR